MIENIIASDFARISLVVINLAEHKPRSLYEKIVDDKNFLLYKLYKTVDQRLARPLPDAFKLKSLEEVLSNVSVIRTSPRQTKYSDWIEDNVVREIEDLNIDVLIRIGFRILRGGILKAAKCGVWSFHHDDNLFYRGGPPGFWEMYEGNPTTGMTLQILSENLDGGDVLCRSFSATHNSSGRKNRNNYYWKGPSLILRQLKKLYNLGSEKFIDDVKNRGEDVQIYSKPLYKNPDNKQMIPFLSRISFRYAAAQLRRLFYFDQWILMYDFKDDISTSFFRFKNIVPPADRFWADPQVVFKDGRYYIFFEEFMYRERRGHISVITLDDTGKCGKVEKALELPYHISYPFVFEWEGSYYMIPETGANKTIDIYKCVSFPSRWEFLKTLIADVTAVDATLLFYSGKWWLFTNIRETPGTSTVDELFVFYADNPLSDNWTSHALNPVVSDVRNSRPAGGIIEKNGVLYRPSQDCSKGYGGGLVINRVDVLSESDYQESTISKVSPDWDSRLKAVHTFNHTNRLTIIDAKSSRRRFFHV